MQIVIVAGAVDVRSRLRPHRHVMRPAGATHGHGTGSGAGSFVTP